jgi:hypothetical protein
MAPFTSPGPNVLGYVHGVGAAAGNSDHVGEGYMYILRKEYCTRYGRAQDAFRTRAKPRGRSVTSDRPPPRRCGQEAWAAAGRPYFRYGITTVQTCVSAAAKTLLTTTARER